MRVERALLEELSEKVFNIGYQGELNHTQVIISCPVMFRDYPDAVASMVVKPPQGDLYPVSLTRDGNDLTWDVSASDVAIPGAGILQLTFTDGEGEEAEIIKTVYGSYSVNASLVANGEAPDPVQSWLDEAGAALATFETEIGDIRKITTATEEDEGLALSPKTVVNGKVTEWEYIDLADPEVVTQAIDDWLDDHPEATTTVEDGAITEAKLNSTLVDDLAWQDDLDDVKNAITQPTFVVGNAEEVLSDRGETDNAVYLFRKTGGTKKAYNREKVKKLVGGTVAWNQQIQNGDFSASTGWSGNSGSVAIASNKLTFTATAKSNFAYVKADSISSSIIGHKYFVSADITVSEASNNVALYRGGIYADRYFTVAANTKTRCSKICSATYENSNFYVYPMREGAGIEVSSTMTLENVVCIDLTAALGSTIADHLYTLETQTAGSGVALFRSLFGKSYYQYSAGSLESVNVSEHRCVGFNQWDEQWELGRYDTSTGNPVMASDRIRCKNAIKVLPNTDYCFVGGSFVVYWYDASGNFITYSTPDNGSVRTSPANAALLKFNMVSAYGTTYQNNICINISDTKCNGQYEPYQQFVYSMPNVTLRGIPKLVNGEIVFDGDELYPDGTVKRRYALVDLSTLAWSYSSGESAWYNTTLKQTGKFAYNNVTWISDKWNAHVWTGRTEGDIVCDGSSNVYCKTTDTVNSPTGYLVYELLTPTTESADGYQELQICNRYGTEEYIDRLATAATSPRDVSIPCGHDTFYPVNVFDYIDELTKPDNNFIADSNIQSGKYFSVGNGLYLSTQAIAQGETITPGTNCTEVSLPDALNALNT